jgi:hypothetical protein
MANKRLSMRKIHEVLRLAFESKLSIRAIARCVNASPATVGRPCWRWVCCIRPTNTSSYPRAIMDWRAFF